MSVDYSEKILTVKDLEVQFNLRGQVLTAIRGISLDIYKGESLAIVGESGSGKSVFTKTFMGMLDKNGKVTKGEILYNGMDLAKFSSEKDWLKIRGKEVAMVFQDPMTSLNPLKTVGKQIQEALELHQNLHGRAARERTIEILSDVGITEPERRYKQYPHEFSGGMRQRAVIATAIACNPNILICDEPTTALDVTIQAQIIELLEQLQKKYRLTIIYITHDLGVVAKVADRIAVMYAGNIVEHGNVFDVFAAPSHPYTRLLMRALPRKTKHEGRLETIDGNVPRITEKKPGCRFANRCPLAKEICSTENPPVLTVSHDHTFSCHFAEEASKL